MSDLNETLSKVINYGLPSPTRPAPPMPTCKPLAKSAEEMLMKAVEYLMLGLDESIYRGDGDFTRGKIYAYEDMAAHLEMLIKGLNNEKV